MRDDMDKLMVLRPRWGSRFPRRGQRRRRRDTHDWNEAPRRGAMGHDGSKRLSENFAPLLRFLRSRLGRPWDDVYSELRAVVRPDSVVKEHVYVHLRQYVNTAVFERDGVLFDGEHGGRPLKDCRLRVQFYVCPRTGRLCELGRKRARGVPARNRDVRLASETLQYHKLAGLWFEVGLALLPASETLRRQAFDCVLRARLDRVDSEQLLERYGDAQRYAVRKRQLSRREIGAVRRLPAARWRR